MRDSAETGDPDTTKGQFPSEQQGAGGGGGGKQAPLPTEQTHVAEPMGGRLAAAFGSRWGFRWDSRPLLGGASTTPGGDPAKYGVYLADGTTDFRGAETDTFLSGPGTVSATGTVSLSLTGFDFIIGHEVRVFASAPTASGTPVFRLDNTINGPSGELFNTTQDARVDFNLTLGYMTTGEAMSVSTQLPMVNPAMYIKYPQFGVNYFGISPSYPGTLSRQIRGSAAFLNPQILHVNGASANATVNYRWYQDTGPSLDSSFMYLSMAGLNRSTIDTRFTAVDYS